MKSGRRGGGWRCSGRAGADGACSGGSSCLTHLISRLLCVDLFRPSYVHQQLVHRVAPSCRVRPQDHKTTQYKIKMPAKHRFLYNINKWINLRPDVKSNFNITTSHRIKISTPSSINHQPQQSNVARPNNHPQHDSRLNRPSTKLLTLSNRSEYFR